MSEREEERLRPTSADAQMVFKEVPKEEYRAWLKSIEPTESEANMEHYRKMFKRAYGEDL